jgi:hypothetical protein
MQPDTELFAVEPGLSRMEEWRARYKVILYPTLDGFRAISQFRNGHGKTKEAALLAWADKAGRKCWKAEELDEIEAAKHKAEEVA